MAGDFNNDAVVDGADLTDPDLGWQVRFGADLDGGDFLAWQRQFGSPKSSVAANAPIPEPTTFLLFIVATAVIRPLWRPNASRTR